MTPLPAPLGGHEIVAWRLDKAIYAQTWNSGEGAYRAGGRWSSKGVRAIYCSLDPATAILEVAVHTGFEPLDTVPHVLTAITIARAEDVHIMEPGALPNANWLTPGHPSAGQQRFGDRLLAQYKFLVAASAVSSKSWNLIFVETNAQGAYSIRSQEPFALDTRLHPPRP